MKLLAVLVGAAVWLTVMPFPIRAIWGTSILGATMFVLLTGMAIAVAFMVVLWRDSAPPPPTMDIMKSRIIESRVLD